MTENKEMVTVNNQIQVGFGTVEGFAALAKQAATIAQSDIVPKAYQNKPANCLIALNMANRLQADPLMVMQNLYTVHGNPSWSSKFLIATFNTCGRYSTLRYEMSGTEGKDDWSCRAWAIEKATGEKLVGTKITISMAKAEGWYGKDGSKWKTMPELMLQYRAAAFFIRAYAPELSVGLMTHEEVIDMEPNDEGTYTQVLKKADATIVENANKETIDINPEPQAPASAPKQEATPAGPGF